MEVKTSRSTWGKPFNSRAQKADFNRGGEGCFAFIAGSEHSAGFLAGGKGQINHWVSGIAECVGFTTGQSEGAVEPGVHPKNGVNTSSSKP